MGFSLGFHIIFASIGITMPLLMVISEALWLRTRDETYLKLTKSWSKGTALFFAVGAVSGTVLSFELGILFPRLMREAGSILGLSLSLEGFAFFTEAIFLGIYLYGWGKVSELAHLFSGIVVALSGALSAIFVTLANAWMQFPSGVRFEKGRILKESLWNILTPPFAAHEVPHSLLASYIATAMAVIGIHAFALLKSPKNFFHLKALKISLAVAIPFCLLQPVIGHFAGQRVARYQPLKIAAMETLLETQTHAPLHLGGIRSYEEERIKGGIELPGMLSFLIGNNVETEVKGLKDFPRKDWPHPLVAYSFQGMVFCGTILMFVSLAAIFLWKKIAEKKKFLWILVAVSPLGYLATELGWIVTEVGRQPWVVYGFLRTLDTTSTAPGLVFRLGAFAFVYLVLGTAVLSLFWQYVRASPGFKGKSSP